MRPQRLEPPGADPHAGWCGRGTISYADRPYADLRRVYVRPMISALLLAKPCSRR